MNKKSIIDETGQAGACEAIEDDVRLFLREWEDSDALPSEAAHNLLRLIFTHERFGEAAGDENAAEAS